MIPAVLSRRLAVLCAVAVTAGAWLPAPHAHFDRAVPVVHAHAVTDLAPHHDPDDDDHDADEHHATFEHGDHSTALTLVQPYHVGARFVLTTATVETVTAVVACSAIASPCRLPRTLLPTHDPPLRFTSSPAPPAVV